jgi:hypothetical protein
MYKCCGRMDAQEQPTYRMYKCCERMDAQEQPTYRMYKCCERMDAQEQPTGAARVRQRIRMRHDAMSWFRSVARKQPPTKPCDAMSSSWRLVGARLRSIAAPLSPLPPSPAFSVNPNFSPRSVSTDAVGAV